jgi:hypothetical protein
VSDDDDIELYRRNSSGVWTVVGTAAGASDAVSTTAPLAPVSSGEGYLGWFAVVSVEQNGTLITIM